MNGGERICKLVMGNWCICEWLIHGYMSGLIGEGFVNGETKFVLVAEKSLIR